MLSNNNNMTINKFKAEEGIRLQNIKKVDLLNVLSQTDGPLDNCGEIEILKRDLMIEIIIKSLLKPRPPLLHCWLHILPPSLIHFLFASMIEDDPPLTPATPFAKIVFNMMFKKRKLSL
jgi:hypothetical protein